MRAAERGLRRAETARGKAGLAAFAAVLGSLRLSSLDQVDNLKTPQEIVVTLEAAAPRAGAGKTTFAREFLPNYADCKNFDNADLIAHGMAPFSPETAALRADRMMLGEIRSFAERHVSFAFETTLSGRSYLPLLRR